MRFLVAGIGRRKKVLQGATGLALVILLGIRYARVDAPGLLSIATAKGEPERVAWVRRLSIRPTKINRHHSQIAKRLSFSHGQPPSQGEFNAIRLRALRSNWGVYS